LQKVELHTKISEREAEIERFKSSSEVTFQKRLQEVIYDVLRYGIFSVGDILVFYTVSGRS